MTRGPCFGRESLGCSGFRDGRCCERRRKEVGGPRCGFGLSAVGMGFVDSSHSQQRTSFQTHACISRTLRVFDIEAGVDSERERPPYLLCRRSMRLQLRIRCVTSEEHTPLEKKYE